MDRPRDADPQDYLSQSGVRWVLLNEAAHLTAEDKWRSVCGHAFRGRPRLRQGTKAEYEYQQELCTHYLIVPFSSDIPGLPVQVTGQAMGAYECHGPLVPLGHLHLVEFFIFPVDFCWSMIQTHEDYGYGGPYSIRAEWLAAGCR